MKSTENACQGIDWTAHLRVLSQEWQRADVVHRLASGDGADETIC